MVTWSIPRVWEGETVGVLASGPSMCLAAANALRAAEIECVAVNTTFQLAPWANFLYGADAAWWMHTPGALLFEGTKVSMEEVRGVNRIGRAGKTGYSDDQTELHTYGNSGAQAIQLAAKAGAKRILVLGMDMQGDHWHGRHPTPLRETHNDTYGLFRDWMRVLAKELERRGVEVLNCCPTSALECFPRVSLEKALAARPVHSQ